MTVTPPPLPDDSSRWRCAGCGNLTRFDVRRTSRTTEFWHFDLAGAHEVEETDVVDEAVGTRLAVRSVVPTAPLMVTGGATDVLRKAGTAVVPDFVSTAGPIFAMWPPEGHAFADVETQAADAIASFVRELGSADTDHLAAACDRSEAFVATWQDVAVERPIT